MGSRSRSSPSSNGRSDTETTQRVAPVVYQPSGNGLTVPAGANANSDGVVNTQLTHLTSRDGPSTATLRYQQSRCSHARCFYGTRHRHSETHDWWEDAASGASVHPPALGKQMCLPAVFAAYDSPTARHDSSNGGNRENQPSLTYMQTVSMVCLRA